MKFLGSLLIEGCTAGQVALSLLALPLRLLNHVVRLDGTKRYVAFTPSVMRNQAIYDSREKRLVKLQIRTLEDYWTVGQVYLSECYGTSHLRRDVELQQLYQSIVQQGRIPLILDCGGNIGLASRYYSENYPAAKVICIEPDGGNVSLARLNVQGRANVEIQQAAIGSANGQGDVLDPGLGNNALRISKNQSGATPIVSVPHILDMHPAQRFVPLIIKIDIEGFEKELFEESTEWVEKFPLISIELHDWLLPRSGSARNLLRVFAPLNRDFIFSGEGVVSFSNDLLGTTAGN